MDVLRSCYSVEASFGGVMDTIDWYFVDGGHLFPKPHRFGSLNWSRTRYGWPPGEIGELPSAPRIYRKGESKAPLSSVGFCGLEDWYRNGIPGTAFFPIVLDDNGDLDCCTGGGSINYTVLPPEPVGDDFGYLVQWDGVTYPGTPRFPPVTTGYGNPPLTLYYGWLAGEVVGRVRPCRSRRFTVANPPIVGGGAAFLIPVAYDPVTRMSTWISPHGVGIPIGDTVTLYPPPTPPPTGSLMTTDSGDYLLTGDSDFLVTE